MAGIITVFAFQYLTWTLPGATVIGGVQGRYFIPLALFVPLMLPKLSLTGRIRFSILTGLILLPCVSLALTMQAILYRFYMP